MVKLTYVLILASGLAATAFSLERTRINRPTSAKIASIRKHQAPAIAIEQSSSLVLKSSESDNSAEIVAANATEEKKGFLSTIWNDNTKLTVYLAVWYLGNIYCK